MKRYGILCLCLMWLLGCSALAESRYARLCEEQKLESADVAAWIEIPGADFCRAVMRHPNDDSFYAKHDETGAESDFGAVYMQSAYNAADFSDPVTLVYAGSRGGAPFRDLQEIFSGRFDECRTIYVHLPDETAQYRVFAAVPHTSVHILHYYDFASERRYNQFFDGVYSSRLLGMHLDESEKPAYGERVLILSTGLRGDAMQRYLVMAKRA